MSWIERSSWREVGDDSLELDGALIDRKSAGELEVEIQALG